MHSAAIDLEVWTVCRSCPRDDIEDEAFRHQLRQLDASSLYENCLCSNRIHPQPGPERNGDRPQQSRTWIGRRLVEDLLKTKKRTRLRIEPSP